MSSAPRLGGCSAAHGEGRHRRMLSVLSYSWHQDISLGCVGTPLHSGGDMGRDLVPFFQWFCIVPFPSPLGFGVCVPVASLGSAQKLLFQSVPPAQGTRGSF